SPTSSQVNPIRSAVQHSFRVDFRPRSRALPMKSPNIPDSSPFASIETERLILRRFVPSDWRAVHRYMSDPQVTAFLPEGLMSPAGARAFAARNAKQVKAVAVIGKP